MNHSFLLIGSKQHPVLEVALDDWVRGYKSSAANSWASKGRCMLCTKLVWLFPKQNHVFMNMFFISLNMFDLCLSMFDSITTMSDRIDNIWTTSVCHWTNSLSSQGLIDFPDIIYFSLFLTPCIFFSNPLNTIHYLIQTSLHFFALSFHSAFTLVR